MRTPPLLARLTGWKHWNRRAPGWAKGGVSAFRRHVVPFAFVTAVLLAARSSLADWNDVPTGSMNPTILEGDRIFVNKLAYDLKVPFTTWHVAEWADPRRGDVVVFYSPVDGDRLVKRVAAVPGDTVAMVNNRLVVNGVPAGYGPPDPTVVAGLPPRLQTGYRFGTESVGNRSHPVMETPGRPARRSFGPVTVPPGKYLVLGDNRDNSYDSRYWGFVDRGQIVGRATGVAVSFDPEHSYAPRWGRTFKGMP